jgi:ribose/xylose/arabinose/galactoside ABC-type transport system permease subunit
MKISDNLAQTSFKQLFLKYGIYFLFLIIVVILSVTTSAFLTPTNIINILLQTSVNGVLAIGMTFVIISGGIDVSIGALMAVSSACGVGLIKLMNAPPALGVIIIILVGLGFGFINGVAVAYLKMPAFLVTLATQGIARGLTLVISTGKSWYDLPEVFVFVGKGTILGLPVIIVMLIIMYVIFFIVLRKTVYGRKVYAIGGNADAARVSGINVPVTTMSVFAVLGLISGIAALMTTARIGSFWAAMGTGVEFSVIAAVVVGGTSLMGGVGSLGGTFIGVMILGIINNALNLWGISSEWQDVFRGLIIFVAVMFDALRTMKQKAD